MQYSQKLAKEAAKRTAEIFGTDYLDNSTGTMTNCCLTNTRLPLNFAAVAELAAKAGLPKEDVGSVVNTWMRQVLVSEYDTFICTLFYNGQWYARWSGQIYLELKDFEWAAEVLKEICVRAMRGEFAKLDSKL
jgi:hypothetical protein